MHNFLVMPLLLAAAVAVGCGNGQTVSSESGAQSTEAASKSDAQSTEAATEVASESGALAVYVEDGVAIEGADPVAYFTEDAYVQGSAEFTHDWNGATWHFASAANRDLFASDPDAYAPSYGGFCAWAVSQGYTAPVDPTAWSIVDGQLYLNYDANIQARWQKDIPGNIAQADENWPGVLAN